MIEYYDNIPEEIANAIEELAYSPIIQWQLLKNTVKLEKDQSNHFGEFKVLEKYTYSSSLFPQISYYSQKVYGKISKEIFPLTEYIALNIIKQPVNLKRIRINMSFYSDKDAILTPHVDASNDDTSNIDKEVSFLYYVNDSSGDTFFFNTQKQLIKRFTPKKGTGVLFKSKTLHAGSYPKDEIEPRIVINFMYQYV